MMVSHNPLPIPLEILSLISPLLSWVEPSQTKAMPKSWMSESNQRAQLIYDPSQLQDKAWLLHELPTFSLDNVEEIIEFGRQTDLSVSQLNPKKSQTQHAYDLYNVFEKLSRRYLVWNGGEVSIRSGRMIELHELGLRLPLSSLIQHSHARSYVAGEQSLKDVVDLPDSISLLPYESRTMRAVVRRGLSEGHLHLNSIHAVERAWADHLLRPIKKKPRSFEDWDWRLLQLSRAAVTCLALALWIHRTGHPLRPGLGKHLLDHFDHMYFAANLRSLDTKQQAFQNYLNDLLPKVIRIEDLAKADRWVRRDPETPGNGLFTGSDPAPAQLGLLHFLGAWGKVLKTYPLRGNLHYRNTADAISREKCLADFHLAIHIALVQNQFRVSPPTHAENQHGQRINEQEHYGQKFLQKTFYRYLICQIHYWQLAVQQGRSTGLKRFKEFYDSNQRWPLETSHQQMADAAISHIREWHGLKVLEGRIGPPKSITRDLIPWLKACVSNQQKDRIGKLGLVIHFIKMPESRPTSNHPVTRIERFSEIRSRYRRDAFHIFRILERPSVVNPFIVGIDAANLELATPPEVFAPVFRFLRDRPIGFRGQETLSPITRIQGQKIRAMGSRRRLGMTYHVGEEFRHLLSGLRAIDEVLEFLNPSPGDRLGHGIALGIKPEVWMKQIAGQALLPKQEWLDTLVWTYHLLGQGHPAIANLKIESQILRLGKEIFKEPQRRNKKKQGSDLENGSTHEEKDEEQDVSEINVFSLQDLRILRQLEPRHINIRSSSECSFKPLLGGDSATLRWNKTNATLLQEVRQKVGSQPPLTLLKRYWYSQKCMTEGKKLTLVKMEENQDTWLQVCQQVQQKIQKKVAEKQLTLEVNPSSNRIIGPMNQYHEHHIFNLCFDAEHQSKKPIRISVNTDNPGTANTSLAHEYYLLGEVLLSRGLSEPVVEQWLEWLRLNGKESSFARHLPEFDDENLAKFIDSLKSYEEPLYQIKDPNRCLAELWRRWPKRKKPKKEQRDSE